MIPGAYRWYGRCLGSSKSAREKARNYNVIVVELMGKHEDEQATLMQVVLGQELTLPNTIHVGKRLHNAMLLQVRNKWPSCTSEF